MSGGWGGLPEVYGRPAWGVERGMGGRQGLSACSKRNAADWHGSSREDLGPRREVYVLPVGEPLQPRVTGEASVVTARNCPPQSL